MGINVEDFEKQEVQDIMNIIDDKISYYPNPDYEAFRTLIKVLVSNGTLTAKQVARALGKAEATSRIDSPVAEQAIACPVVQSLKESEQK